MATAYTDVDLMILNRWDEVRALRDAYEDVLRHIRDVVESTLQRVTMLAAERGFSANFSSKPPEIWFWKSEWATRKNEPGMYFVVSDFIPADCAKDIDDFPSVQFSCNQLVKLKLRERPEEFGRALRAELSPELRSKWSHEDADLADTPLAMKCTDITDADRVRLVKDPEVLARFMTERIDEFMEVVPHIDTTLQKMTRR